ncbi:hypothetical protein B0T13DRAFT_281829 [Neurospora crassa]|nr:hypothetical protein B0T13DRAFT_281829 [Neurospora crassa]
MPAGPPRAITRFARPTCVDGSWESSTRYMASFVLRAVDDIESWSMTQYYPHPVRVLNTVKALALFTGLSLPYVCVHGQ